MSFNFDQFDLKQFELIGQMTSSNNSSADHQSIITSALKWKSLLKQSDLAVYNTISQFVTDRDDCQQQTENFVRVREMIKAGLECSHCHKFRTASTKKMPCCKISVCMGCIYSEIVDQFSPADRHMIYENHQNNPKFKCFRCPTIHTTSSSLSTFQYVQPHIVYTALGLIPSLYNALNLERPGELIHPNRSTLIVSSRFVVLCCLMLLFKPIDINTGVYCCSHGDHKMVFDSLEEARSHFDSCVSAHWSCPNHNSKGERCNTSFDPDSSFHQRAECKSFSCAHCEKFVAGLPALQSRCRDYAIDVTNSTLAVHRQNVDSKAILVTKLAGILNSIKVHTQHMDAHSADLLGGDNTLHKTIRLTTSLLQLLKAAAPTQTWQDDDFQLRQRQLNYADLALNGSDLTAINQV
jgi:hypothetical protein